MIHKAEGLVRLGGQSGFGGGQSSSQDQEKFDECLSAFDDRKQLSLMSSGLPATIAQQSQARVLTDRQPKRQRRGKNALIHATNEMFQNLLGLLAGD